MKNARILAMLAALAARPLTVLAVLAMAVSACASVDDGTNEDGEQIGESDEALGAVYNVGPARTYKTIAQVASLLKAGDTVLVDGDATYAGGVKFTVPGTASAKITIKGVRVNGKRPVLSGSINTIEMNQNHYVLEGFDVTGGTSRCIYHHAHGITVRDTVVHHCPAHGILGADTGSGSLTLEYVEVHNSGAGDTKHPIYI